MFCVNLKCIVFCLHEADFFLSKCLPDASQDPSLRELATLQERGYLHRSGVWASPQ